MNLHKDQRRLGAIIVPNKDEILESAKRLSILDEKMEIPKGKLLKFLYDEVRTWYSHFNLFLLLLYFFFFNSY